MKPHLTFCIERMFYEYKLQSKKKLCGITQRSNEMQNFLTACYYCYRTAMASQRSATNSFRHKTNPQSTPNLNTRISIPKVVFSGCTLHLFYSLYSRKNVTLYFLTSQALIIFSLFFTFLSIFQTFCVEMKLSS